MREQDAAPSAEECRRAEALWRQAHAAGRAVVPPLDELRHAGDREEAERRAMQATVAAEDGWSVEDRALVFQWFGTVYLPAIRLAETVGDIVGAADEAEALAVLAQAQWYWGEGVVSTAAVLLALRLWAGV